MANEASDSQFARSCLDQGLLTADQLASAREVQEQLSGMGMPEDLPTVLVKKGFLTDEQLKQVQRAAPGKRQLEIEGYQLMQRVGRGAMGAVFRARQNSLDRVVALKILPPSLARDEQFIDRFFKEARSAGRLNHPNIVQGIDVGESNGYYFFAMEFVEGETAQERLRREGPFPEKLALKVATDVAHALEHAHEHSLVHGDIKPDNIMIISKTQQAKLCDLGLARPIQQGMEGQRSKAIMGTPHYISPEQARGQLDIDIRSDIYSLGATLYHLVTGKTPFAGSSSKEVMQKHLSEDLVSPQDINPDVPDRIAQLIEKMMAKDRDDRYEKPQELLEDLERVAKGRRPKAARLAEGKSQILRSTGRRSGRESTRHPAPPKPNWQVPAAVVSAVVLGLVMLLFAANGKNDSPRPNNGRGNTQNANTNTPVNQPPAQAVNTNGPNPQQTPPASQNGSQGWQALLDEAKATLADDPNAYDEAMELLVKADRAARTAEGKSAVKAEIDRIRAERISRREEAFAALQQQVEELRAERQYRKAHDLLLNEKFPAHLLEGTSAYHMMFLSEARRALMDTMAEDWKADEQNVRTLLDQRDVEAARALVEPWTGSDVDTYRTKAETLMSEVAALEQQAQAEAAAAHAEQIQQQLTRELAQIMGLVIDGELDKAEDRIKRCQANVDFKPSQQPFDWLLHDIDQTRRQRAALAEHYAQKVGQSGEQLYLKGIRRNGTITSVRGETMMFQLANGPEVPVTIWDQPARVLMKLLDLDDDKPAHRLMLAMFNLCGGKTEGTNTARHYLQTLTESTDYGEKASFYLDAIDEAHAWELLNKGWQAFAAGQWAAVRSHLAELREAYGETDVYAHFAGGLEGHGPDVDTMLAKAEEALGPEETTTAEASEEKPAKAEPLKTFKVLKANAERRARLEMQMAQRHGRLWHTIHVLERMGDIDKAERLMQRITMQGQSPNQDSHPVEHHGRLVHYTRDHTIRRNAYAFMDHAKLLIMCDKQKYVEPMLQKASEIIGEQVMAPAWLVERPDRIRQFAAEYEQNVARLTELESKAATDPDPDTLYQIVRLTDPDDYDAPDAMKHFEAVHRLVETFPEYDRVKNGDLLWNYFRVLRDYHLYEKAIAVDERLMKECPDYRHVKRQDAEWDKAETYVRWGLFLESIGDPRRALECYKTARTLFNKFRLAHKSDRRVIWRSRPPPQSAAPPIVRGRLEAVTGAINRLSKR